MTPGIQVGSILIGRQSPRMTEALALESEPYIPKWSVVKALDGFALGGKIHAAGWTFFFMAAEVKATFFGAAGAQKIQDALKRILGKVKAQNFNCLEVTGVVTNSFFGVPYTTVSAHSRHIQPGNQLEGAKNRRNGQHGT